MGYLKEKYTKKYFLKIDEKGNPTKYGVEGAELFNKGKAVIRDVDRNILDQINFKNKTVLDFGFGRGEALKYSSDKGAKTLFGVDFSKASYEIATSLFKRHKIKANIECMDALDYVEKILKRKVNINFDVILMLDFVEHIPRVELSAMFKRILNLMSPKGIVVINTPVFNVDNDVVLEGIKREAFDTSDLFIETRGMHCNRYTRESLNSYLMDQGLYLIKGHIYTKKSNYKGEVKTKSELTKYLKMGLPLNDTKFIDDVFEYANISQEDKIRIDAMYIPTWHKIKNGLLKGRPFYIDTKDGLWQQEIVEGNFDKFFWDVLSKIDLKGKVILDIGSHIGFHTMCFAELVGTKGKVLSFEPNIFNIERMNFILEKNKDLKSRIEVCNYAISDKKGLIDFSFSKEIDNGFSSGSFISGAITPYNETQYKDIGFEKIRVKTVTLDSLMDKFSIDHKPNYIKIDIEGAEDLALAGAKEFTEIYKPTYLIELHTFTNIIETFQFFSERKYEIKFLEFISDTRSFIIAKYNQSYDEHVLKDQIKMINEISIKVTQLKDQKFDEAKTISEKHQKELRKEIETLNKENFDLKLVASNLEKKKEVLENELEQVNQQLLVLHDQYFQLFNSLPLRITRKLKKNPFLYKILKNAQNLLLKNKK